MTAPRIWTKHETDRVQRLLNSGVAIDVVAETLGRTAGAVRRHLHHVAMSPEQMARQRMREKERHARERHRKMGVVTRSFTAAVPPPEVLDERDRCINLQHRSLSAYLCGDPLPGRSALDRRGCG